ncbi:MAG: PKD domain-containing protein [Candidatus Thermoplasmatota archaeon]|nr:PKD domain-containing protein [Candidatus Thermoplasmatota archaeon]
MANKISEQGEVMRPAVNTGIALLLAALFLITLTAFSSGEDLPKKGGSISPDPEWSGIPTVTEDSIPVTVMLDGSNSPFRADHENITGYLLAPEGSENGSIILSTWIATLSIVGVPSSFSLLIEPLPGMNGWASFELIAVGENTICNRTAALRISPVNDPPEIISIIVGDREHPVSALESGVYGIDMKGLEKVYDGDTLNFTINATDGDQLQEGDDISFRYDPEGSDLWDERPIVDVVTGAISLRVAYSDWSAGNEKLVFRVQDLGFQEVKLLVFLEIDHMNRPPVITVPADTRYSWTQYEMLEVRLDIFDPDSIGDIFVEVNIEDPIDGSLPSLKEQLPHTDLVPGGNVGLDRDPGLFWMDLTDQNIWKTGDRYLGSMQVFLMFMATDPGGANSTVTLMMELIDLNEPPVWTGGISVNLLGPAVGERVTIQVDPAADPEMDLLTYHWDFGDGSVGEGRIVEHIYYSKGYRTILCRASDGNGSTDMLTFRIEVHESEYVDRSEWYEMDNDGDGILNRADAFPNDRAASKDSDGDGHPDMWNSGYDRLDSTTGLVPDMFPMDRMEWLDSDGDGHGDNGDEFPYNIKEWKDTDGDGIGDNADRSPRIPNHYLKWYAIGTASVLLALIGSILFILRNIMWGEYEGRPCDEE